MVVEHAAICTTFEWSCEGMANRTTDRPRARRAPSSKRLAAPGKVVLGAGVWVATHQRATTA